MHLAALPEATRGQSPGAIEMRRSMPTLRAAVTPWLRRLAVQDAIFGAYRPVVDRPSDEAHTPGMLFEGPKMALNSAHSCALGTK
jgi:hypothetical protein